MTQTPEPSIVGLMTQFAAIVLVATLSFLMSRSIRRTFLQYWTIAWTVLALALGCLLGAFYFGCLGFILLPLYVAGEYAFGYLFIAGCRNYVHGESLTRREWWLVPVALLLALEFLALTKGNFDILFIPHAAVVSYLFMTAFRVLRGNSDTVPRTAGRRVMSTALFLLAIDFLHYIPVFTYSALSGSPAPLTHLHYTSLYDLVLEVLLGFGMVMTALEHVARELEWSNAELVDARTRVEALARIDPLTEALNRHGLYTYIEQHPDGSSQSLSGCVGLVDLDNLKVINDSLGHAAGDAAIRAVACAIRNLIRPEDQLVRWGGDEFLILTLNLTASQARQRLEALETTLAETTIPGRQTPLAITVSFGLCDFSSRVPLQSAIEKADNAMYAQKLARKSQAAEAATA